METRFSPSVFLCLFQATESDRKWADCVTALTAVRSTLMYLSTAKEPCTKPGEPPPTHTHTTLSSVSTGFLSSQPSMNSSSMPHLGECFPWTALHPTNGCTFEDRAFRVAALTSGTLSKPHPKLSVVYPLWCFVFECFCDIHLSDCCYYCVTGIFTATVSADEKVCLHDRKSFAVLTGGLHLYCRQLIQRRDSQGWGALRTFQLICGNGSYQISMIPCHCCCCCCVQRLHDDAWITLISTWTKLVCYPSNVPQHLLQTKEQDTVSLFVFADIQTKCWPMRVGIWDLDKKPWQGDGGGIPAPALFQHSCLSLFVWVRQTEKRLSELARMSTSWLETNKQKLKLRNWIISKCCTAEIPPRPESPDQLGHWKVLVSGWTHRSCSSLLLGRLNTWRTYQGPRKQEDLRLKEIKHSVGNKGEAQLELSWISKQIFMVLSTISLPMPRNSVCVCFLMQWIYFLFRILNWYPCFYQNMFVEVVATRPAVLFNVCVCECVSKYIYNHNNHTVQSSRQAVIKITSLVEVTGTVTQCNSVIT